ncbi:DUF4300 family protein [Capnocytophaga genosp. AHN8471]|uniref:DUF4300 family protein n=1 Tax=Capnocytophaga genosp. AHN8471 TaxID=327574 RepID=A0ABS1YZG4_9FLAO|nr:DUF4300 family protein [Capnocytophaga genosp. AHN8471]MBM0651804.1 DUF4300 family protein [Capnocytophaga genosp. AHN8471]MBM0660622.1 DUF4300 family protein [Capnocytophaga genosp. AHN8471]
MKKLLLITILSLGAISCEQKKATTEKTNISLTYSNLVDTATQDEVQKALTAAGIAEQNVASFLESVALFNQTVGDKAGLVPKGFVTIDSLLPKYDEVAIQSIWTSKYPMFQGYNCRLTSFTLLRDLITFPADKKFATKEEDEVLFIDRESLHNTPKKFFTPEEENNFFTLFTEVPTTNTKDINTHLQAMQQAWKERGIKFRYKNDPTKASLISAVFHSQITPEENTLFVGHVGVLVPFEGKLLFIEKLAFQEPYQAIKFANRTQLSDYLMNRYDVEWEQPNAIPFIMENDALMEGYRPNPYKKEQRL